MPMLAPQQQVTNLSRRQTRILERLRAEGLLNELQSVVELLDDSFGLEASAFRLCFEFVYDDGTDGDLGEFWTPLYRVTREDIVNPFKHAVAVQPEVARVAAWVFRSLFLDAGAKSPLTDEEWTQMMPDWGISTFW